MVVHTFPSGTSTISSRFSLQILKFNCPTCFTAAPSTNLSIVSKYVFSPFAIEVFMAGAPNGSTPIILVFGLNSAKTVESPAAKPPPPMGTKT